jgi:HD-GYP domain-containing protein (c-di-GMP phosphodiesterase class II)
MARQVLYDLTAPAAVTAAALLSPDYDIEPWNPDSPADGVLLTSRAERQPVGGVRVVGIIEPGPQAWWPDTWYALVPADAPRAVLTRAVANAWADVDAAAERSRLEHELGELNAIGIQLSAERDISVLLATILGKACEITGSDAGSLYLIEEDAEGTRRLRFALAQNASVPIAFRARTLPLDSTSVAGHVALSGEVVNLADAYEAPPEAPFHINRSFDEQTGYRTKSMLVVPMRTPHGQTLGAIQLINSRPGFDGRLTSAAEVARHVRPYTARHVRLAGSLASQAAVALLNRRLYENISDLFEGFVKAAVTAIESRDPTTSGHSFRVAAMTTGLAEVVSRTSRGVYADVRFTEDEMRELRYAALLHDFGKVGVREHVLVKAKKLYPCELERIETRAAMLIRDLELDAMRRKLGVAIGDGADAYARHAARIDQELAAAVAEQNEALELIVAVNEPSVHARDFTSELLRVTAQSPILTPEEARILAIPRGSLTEDERLEIQQHVVHTYEFLARIPWTRELRRIPEIARSHHEKLNGSGYPLGVSGDEIPVQARMMTIADMYDALTATDRPYKKAVRVEEALDTLRAEQRAGAIDEHLLELFIDARVFARSA